MIFIDPILLTAIFEFGIKFRSIGFIRKPGDLPIAKLNNDECSVFLDFHKIVCKAAQPLLLDFKAFFNFTQDGGKFYL